MRQHFIRIEVEEGEIEKILQELAEAQETIYRCYNQLQESGVLVIRKLPAATDSLADQSSFSSSSTKE